MATDESVTGQELRPCGLLRRLCIMLYDSLAVVAILILATGAAMLLGMDNRTAGKDPAFTLGLLLTWFLYLGWCWNRIGMTLGMRAWRVEIQAEDDGRPGWGQCVIRFLVSLVSAGVAGLGFLLCLFRKDRQTWHDRASRTRLVFRPKIKRSAGE